MSSIFLILHWLNECNTSITRLKNLQKSLILLIQMIHNCKKYFLLIFFLFFWISCKTVSFVTSNKKVSSTQFIGDYFQKSKVLNPHNFFEKPSSQYKFLVVRGAENGNLKVKEIEIFLYAYTNKFLEEVNAVYPEKAPPKFTIYEKIKYGEGKNKDDSSDLEVEYTNFSIRQSQSSDLITGIDKFIHRKTEAQQLFHEKISYSITPDDGLWKSEEILLKDGQEFTRWKHFPSGTLERNYPYTEFHPNKNTLEYSRIYSFEDYSFKKFFKDIPSGSKLYTNKEFVIYYYPGEKFDPQDANLIYFTKNNKQLTLYKANLPLLIYKKKESTIE